MNYISYIRVTLADGNYEDFTYTPPDIYGEIGFNNGILTVCGYAKAGYLSEMCYAPGQWLRVETRYMVVK